MGFGQARVHRRERTPVAELIRQLDRTLEDREGLLRAALIRQHDSEVGKAPEAECRIGDDAFIARLHAFAKQTDRVLVGVRLRVRRRERRLDPDLLRQIVEQLRHALCAFQQREGLFRLAIHVVRDREVPKPHELIGGRQTLIERLEQRDGFGGLALLDEPARFDEVVLGLGR